MSAASQIFKILVDRWPSPLVCRTEVEKFTGGAISKEYIANLDCQGLGPDGRIRIGRKICYPTESLARWLEKRSVSLDE